jgi:folate-binding protein YgfZ
MQTEAQTTPEHDYEILTRDAGVLDRSARGKLDVLGDDAFEYLQGQVTNDVESLTPGTGCYAAILNPKGHILADLRVLARAPGELWLDTEAAALDAALADLRMYKIGRRVDIADRTGDRALLSLIGPAADQVARDALGLARLPAAEHEFVEGEIGGAPAVLVRTDIGLDLLLDGPRSERAVEVLVGHGAAVVGETAAEILRIEGGRPRFGIDMGIDNLPAEVGIVDRAVSFTKGCYVGQEPVARMHYKGRPNRHLRGVALEHALAGGEELFAGEKSVGRVTSACVSPALGPIGLALVRREIAPADEVSVGQDGNPARIVELPFERS